jgi:hypothetical protein
MAEFEVVTFGDRVYPVEVVEIEVFGAEMAANAAAWTSQWGELAGTLGYRTVVEMPTIHEMDGKWLVTGKATVGHADLSPE